MNQIQYFKRTDGTGWVAILHEQYLETLHFWEFSGLIIARIELNKSAAGSLDAYQHPESKYIICNQQEYLAARHKAQSAIADSFSQFQPIHPTPIKSNPALMDGFLAQVRKPGPFVTLATGRTILNDLPF
ncbi:hypothetical protein M0L20_28545 [Spirosoma sp. RP8]|uniref:Uncharacterized protein n=1 Tax=Spirosoma liriopis TaxID=2937440 RepID=A0ABT0HUM8_9BACT|nr:hypothetical protein [Spirosoma liriopis]MCK8495849.1 hypothetical protein [Spirosoma liriopis]